MMERVRIAFRRIYEGVLTNVNHSNEIYIFGGSVFSVFLLALSESLLQVVARRRFQAIEVRFLRKFSS